MLMCGCVRRWQAWRPMTASGRSSCAPGTAPNRCSCRRMPCSSASAAPPAPAAPRGSGWPPTPPGTWSPAATAPQIRAAAGRCPGSRCRWRPIGPACSPRGTCAAGRSNAAQRPSARDQWRWRSSTAGSRRRAVTEPPAVASPDAEVYNNTSQTLEAIGVADDIERSGRYQPLRLRLYRMDREMQRREMRTLAAAPDYVVGSVHALTEDGSLLIASASGSQLGPLVSGAGHAILVIGAQKIVSDVATGMRRIYEYCYPLEDARARRAYGVPSGVNNILIINKVITAGRITAIIVNERLGF